MYMLALCLVAALVPSDSTASLQDTSMAAPPDSSGIVQIGADLYRLGSLTLDLSARTVSAPGRVNMDTGMVEVLACTPWGKTHESVLVLDVEPYKLQVALLLLGLHPGSDSLSADAYSGPKGDSAWVSVEWQIEGLRFKYRAENLLWDVIQDRPMPPSPWVFTGSRVSNGIFMAQVGGSLITSFNDPDAILDNPLPTGSDDTVYAVNDKLVPARGTPVTLTIHASDFTIPDPDDR